MIVEELPKGTNLLYVRLKLPTDALEKYKDYAGGEEEMYIVGNTMGDFFMSPNPPGKHKRRLYPLPLGVTPQDMLKWEVVEVLPENKEE